MKKIHSISCGIAKYKFHQREISKLGIGSEVSLRIKKKENGYKDIFVYNEDKEIGELFYEESTQLLPFVSDDKKFRVETIVKKLLPKEEDMISVIVDVKIYCDEEIDADDYIDNFYGYSGTEEEQEDEEISITIDENRKKIEQEEIARHNKILQKQENEAMKGCLIFVVIGIIIFLIFKMCSSARNSENIYEVSDIDNVVDSVANAVDDIYNLPADTLAILNQRQMDIKNEDDEIKNAYKILKSKEYYIDTEFIRFRALHNKFRRTKYEQRLKKTRDSLSIEYDKILEKAEKDMQKYLENKK